MDINQLPKKSNTKSVRPKVVFSVALAVISTVALIFAIYSIFFKKDTFLFEKLITPKVSVDQNQDLQSQTQIFTVDELSNIEENIVKNEVLQSLKLYADVPVNPEPIGNSNPFRPFSDTSLTDNQKEEIQEVLTDIEKPLPRR